MTDEIENGTPTDQSAPKEQSTTPTPVAKKPILTKPSGNPFVGKSGNFSKGKTGSAGFKGKIFKGSGVKKGK
jgi:hypothetical protein